MAEVLSPSTADFDQHEKLEEYRTVPSLRHILNNRPGPAAPPPAQPRRGWPRESAPHAGLEAVVPLPALGIAMPLAELYDGLTFRPLPRLVLPIETSPES